MENLEMKKRIIKITLLGKILILIGIIVSLNFIFIMTRSLVGLDYITGRSQKPFDLLPRIISGVIKSISFFLIGIGIIKLKRWALIAMFILLVITSPAIIGLLLTGAIVNSTGIHLLGCALIFAGILYFLFIIVCFIFFTRRNIKEQFK